MAKMIPLKTEQDYQTALDNMTAGQRAFVEAMLNPDYIPLAVYCREAWRVVEPATPFLPNWHIEAISDHLEAVTFGEIRNLIINIPPRHMKSLTVSVFWPTWTWTFAPATRWLFASYAEALAIRDSLKSRRIIQSEWYQNSWKHVFTLTGDQNQKSRFENSKTGYRLATGVGGIGTGEGGDFIVVDDPHKVKEAESATVREGVLEWWDSTMPTRLNNPKTGAKVIIQQRVHEADLSGHLLEKMKEGGETWELLKIPAEYEPTVSVTGIGFTDPRQEPGELLWENRFDRESIDNLKRSLGSRRAAGQLQQNPAPAEGDIFKRQWWRFWLPAGVNAPPITVRLSDNTIFTCPQMSIPGHLSDILQSWDMTFSDNADNAFVVGQVWARHLADKFLLDQVRDRWGLPATLKAVTSLSEKWPKARLKLVENKANGPAVIQTLRNKVPGMVAINPMGDKVARAEAVAPEAEAGNVYLPHPALFPWVESWILEHTNFPNSAYMDQVDTHSQALARYIADDVRKKGRKTRSHSTKI